jgi:hypothetical protein
MDQTLKLLTIAMGGRCTNTMGIDKQDGTMKWSTMFQSLHRSFSSNESNLIRTSLPLPLTGMTFISHQISSAFSNDQNV